MFYDHVIGVVAPVIVTVPVLNHAETTSEIFSITSLWGAPDIPSGRAFSLISVPTKVTGGVNKL